MKLLEEKILECGKILPGGIVKVDSFLNHQIDVAFIDKMGEEFHKVFGNCGVNKILTVEASGIGIACLVARHFGNVPVVFAKKNQSANQSTDLLTAKVHSYTKGIDFLIRVDRNYISPGDKILIIDDFLANGNAMMGLIDIVEQGGAETVGVGICVEKAFQPGGDMLRKKGVNLCSLAIVDVDENGKPFFVEK